MQVARQITWDTAAPAWRPEPRPQAPRLAPGVAPKSRVRAVNVVLFTALWAIGVGGALLYVHRTAEVARAGFGLTALKQQIQEVESANEALEAQAAELRSIARIEKLAIERLQMLKPMDFRVASVDRAAIAARSGPAVAAAPATRAEPGLLARAWQYVASFRLTTNTAAARSR